MACSLQYTKVKSLLLLACLIKVLFGQLEDCGILVGRNGQVGGIGVFATRNYKKGQAIERCIAFKVPHDKTTGNILDHYVFGHSEEDGVYYADIVLGHAMLFNHRDNSSIEVVEQHKVPSPRQPVGIKDVHDFVVFATADIAMGQELFSNYGGSPWFQERLIPYVEVPSLGQDSGIGSVLGGCPLALTDIYNGRVYAKQPIAKGSVIEVARGLILDSSITAGQSVDDYMWRALGSSGDRVMLVLGNGALYRARNDSESATVYYDWSPEAVAGAVGSAVVDPSGANQPASVVCSEKMLVRFFAARDILVNEELTITLYDTRFSSRPQKRLAKLSGSCF